MPNNDIFLGIESFTNRINKLHEIKPKRTRLVRWNIIGFLSPEIIMLNMYDTDCKGR